MYRLRHVIPFLLLFAAAPSVTQAQVSLPLTTTTYYVEVEYEFWRNGSSYWSTVYQTEDQADAELMYLALLSAYENGEICDILDCSFDWIITGVRLRSETKLNYQFESLPYRWSDDLYIFSNQSSNYLSR